jgi:hypothetical protein
VNSRRTSTIIKNKSALHTPARKLSSSFNENNISPDQPAFKEKSDNNISPIKIKIESKDPDDEEDNKNKIN